MLLYVPDPLLAAFVFDVPDPLGFVARASVGRHQESSGAAVVE